MEFINLKGPFLALDWGAKKIGWATGDDLKITTTPHPIRIRNKEAQKWLLSKEDKAWLGEIVENWTPGTIVLGIPLGLRGEENTESTGARELAKEIYSTYSIQVVLINEALSTWEIKGQKDEDSRVAAILLKDYWDQLSRNG